jgi:hypothetical protein
MIVISPWSKGGWVNSQVLDHTSLIRFVERHFGVMEPNITPWRRAVTDDLTSAFDFETPNAAVVSLPITDAFQPAQSYIINGTRFPDFVPPVPANQSLPQQEPGTRPARALRDYPIGATRPSIPVQLPDRSHATRSPRIYARLRTVSFTSVKNRRPHARHMRAIRDGEAVEVCKTKGEKKADSSLQRYEGISKSLFDLLT